MSASPAFRRRLSEIVQTLMLERAGLIEAAIIQRAEHGQRVEECRHHIGASGLTERVELIVHGEPVHTVYLPTLV